MTHIFNQIKKELQKRISDLYLDSFCCLFNSYAVRWISYMQRRLEVLPFFRNGLAWRGENLFERVVSEVCDEKLDDRFVAFMDI